MNEDEIYTVEDELAHAAVVALCVASAIVLTAVVSTVLAFAAVSRLVRWLK